MDVNSAEEFEITFDEEVRCSIFIYLKHSECIPILLGPGIWELLFIFH